ncbi:MAG: hypothetical protein ACRDGM_16355 [bacterium]
MPILGMILGKLFEALAKAAVEYLQWVSMKKDIVMTERARIYLESQKATIRALEWKTSHHVAPPDDPTGDFRVER